MRFYAKPSQTNPVTGTAGNATYLFDIWQLNNDGTSAALITGCSAFIPPNPQEVDAAIKLVMLPKLMAHFGYTDPVAFANYIAAQRQESDWQSAVWL